MEQGGQQTHDLDPAWSATGLYLRAAISLLCLLAFIALAWHVSIGGD